MTDRLDWTPLHPTIGAEVAMDLSREVSEGEIAALRCLFDERHLLLFRGQSLSGAEQLRICSWFGPVQPGKQATVYATDPEVGAMGAAEITFHSDLSCAPEPLEGISLYALDVDERSPPTRFADAMAAAAALPVGLAGRMGTLHTENLWPLKLAVRQRRRDAPEDWPGTVHPLLKPHPRNGLPILFVNASHTDRIVELDEGASEELIGELFGRLYAPANRYDHHWQGGDLVIWDNLALQHARPQVAEGVPRTLRRVEIGSDGYMDQMPAQLLAAYNIE